MPLTEPTKLVLKSYGTPGAIAGVVPTLDYRFALDRNEIDAATLTDKLTVTRAATAAVNGPTGYLELAGPNVARFNHDLTTHQSLGLLVEEASTNLLQSSSNFLLSPWSCSFSAIANSTIAPDGTFTGTKITNGYYSGINQSMSLSGFEVGTQFTFSLFIKKVPGFDYNQSGLQFRLWTRPVFGTDQYDTLTNILTPLRASSGEWIRVSHTMSFVQNSTVAFSIQSPVSSPDIQVYIWGAQVEQGSSPTSYIQTTNSTVSRTESATINGTGVITGTYTMVEKPAGCAVVNGTNIDLQTGYTAERVMVFPAALSGAQITAIRSAM